MKEIIILYNKIMGSDEVFLTIKEMISNIRNRDELDKSSLIDFLQLVFQKLETRVTEEGVTYDYEFIYNTNIVSKYKERVKELGDMMIDIIDKNGKLKLIEKDFFNELKAINNQLFKLIDTRTKGDTNALLRTFICDGYKINPQGKVIGFNHESLMEGITSYEDQFNSGVQGRIPAIINASAVGSAGYIARKMEFLFSFLVLTDANDDCKPEMNITITDKNIKKYTGRILENGEIIERGIANGNYKIFSPINCKSKVDGRYAVCKKCCGKLSSKWDEFESLGTIYSVITERLTQSLLSSKHLIKINFKTYDGITYLGNDKLIISNDYGISEEGILTHNGEEVPFMKRDLKWIDESKGEVQATKDWYSIDTKSLLPYAKAIFNKTQRFKEINDPYEYLKEMMDFDEVSKLGIQSIFYELFITLLNRKVSDNSILAKDTEELKEIVSPISAIMSSNHYDRLFFQQFNQQLNSPSIHMQNLSKDGGLFGLFINKKEKEICID